VESLRVALSPDAGERAYPIHIGAGLLERAELYAPHLAGSAAIVTNEVVAPLYLARVKAALQSAGAARIVEIVVEDGEQAKRWANLERIFDALLAARFGRDCVIVALGGGVVGDLAGFAAATYQRGVPFIQVPTTLLAQVDSSVGGKTAINHARGKNMVGAFHQPAAVLIDPETLDTLPLRELRAGYAEVVKYGLIDDPAFFSWCEANGAALLTGDAEARLHAIEQCVRAKARIVGEDERETKGRRALLNLGHTFGHAVEAESGYAVLHGEAVAIGMALAFRFSAERGLCAGADAERVEAHLAAVGLPRRVEVGTAERLVGHMVSDKKASGGRVPFILARGIGEAFVDTSVELAEVEAFLAREMAR
jgi:3-dehydroquinate synthase